MIRSNVPEIRVRTVVDRPAGRGSHVLYWMTAFRRLDDNFALQRAVDHANALDLPLVVLEGLRCDYPWASRRFHRFVLDGMEDNAAACRKAGVAYRALVEQRPGAGHGVWRELAEEAAVVVTDDYPAFFHPRMIAAAGKRLDVLFEAVDANGLLPLRAADKAYPTAYAFRRHLQKALPEHLGDFPEKRPLQRLEYGHEDDVELDDVDLDDLPIDADVAPIEQRGGSVAGRELLDRFVDERLDAYEERNQPEAAVTSELSGHLHFGHVSAHTVFREIAERHDWSPAELATKATGSRQGWWGLPAPVEGFLDECVTWREVGYNAAVHLPRYERYESLPPWARATLEEHAGDEREHLYDLPAFEAAETHDPLWNAAQRQLVAEGRIHNYLRMLWGKKILEWSAAPQAAAEIMIELNNKYAIDGRDPNSYSGIYWVLGRYDRPWGPERPIFGKIRYMSSQNTARKVRVAGYLERWGEGSGTGRLF